MEIKALSVAANIHKNLKPHLLASFFLYLSISGLAVCYKKSPSANACTFADGDYRYIAPACPPHKCTAAIRKVQGRCHAAASSFSLSCV